MQVPPEIAFRQLDATDEFKELILEKIDDLEEVYPRLVSCRIMVADETPGQHSGKNIRVRIEMGIPGRHVVVDEDNSEGSTVRSVEQTIRDAFSTGRSRLKKEKALQHGDVKTHDLPPHGRVTRLLTDETGVRYGFIQGRDGQSIYFHEDAIVGMEYEDIDVGDEVRIAVAGGDDGPQASTVAPMSDEPLGPEQEREVPLRS